MKETSEISRYFAWASRLHSHDMLIGSTGLNHVAVQYCVQATASARKFTSHPWKRDRHWSFSLGATTATIAHLLPGVEVAWVGGSGLASLVKSVLGGGAKQRVVALRISISSTSELRNFVQSPGVSLKAIQQAKCCLT